MVDEQHIPGQVEAEIPLEEEEHKEEVKEETPQEEEPKEEPKDTPEEKEPEEKPEEEPEEPAKPIKKRSIYQDLKQKKAEVKEAKDEASTLREENERLQALIDQKEDANTPEEKAEADDEIAAFAKEQNLDAKALRKMAAIFGKRFQPSKEVQDQLAGLQEWKDAELRKGEDSEIRALAPTVKEQLNVQDDAELSKVMDEVVRLAHTDEFHDKEIEYIIWKNQAKLSKLVSPKKASFESGDTRPDADEKGELEYSGKMTPEQVAKDMYGTPD